MNPKVLVCGIFNCYKIYINDILHLYLRNIHELLSIQSWIDGGNNKFWIEYTYKSGMKILTEYEDYELFCEILKQLDAL